MDYKNNTAAFTETSAGSEKKLWKLFNICTLILAIISFYTTSQGLNTYFFNGNVLCGTLVSFAIQGVLLGLNLKLPKYISSKSRFSRNSIIATYAFSLLWSTGFSYIYVSNQAYAPVFMKDGQTKLVNAYMQAKNDLKKRSQHDFTNVLRTVFAEIGNLQQSASLIDRPTDHALAEAMPDFTAMRTYFYDHAGMIAVINKLETLSTGKPMGSISQLEETMTSATKDLLEEKTQLEQQIADKENKLRASSDKILSLSGDKYSFRSNSTADAKYDKEILYEESARAALELELQALNNQLNEKTEMIKQLDTLKNYASAKASSTSSMLTANFSNILAELGSTEPDIEAVNTYADQIFTSLAAAMQTDGNNDQYSQVLNNYLLLQTTLSELQNIRTIQVYLNKKDTIIHDTDSLVSSTPSENELQAWRDTWNSVISQIKQDYYLLPSAADSTEDGKEINNICQSFSTLQRNLLMDLNGIEKAFQYLFGDYPKLAWFSLVLSLYLDVSPILIGFYKYHDIHNTTSKQPRKVFRTAFAGSTLAVLFLIFIAGIR